MLLLGIVIGLLFCLGLEVLWHIFFGHLDGGGW